jgi:hypothetical protein
MELRNSLAKSIEEDDEGKLIDWRRSETRFAVN